MTKLHTGLTVLGTLGAGAGIGAAIGSSAKQRTSVGRLEGNEAGLIGTGMMGGLTSGFLLSLAKAPANKPATFGAMPLLAAAGGVAALANGLAR